MATPTPNGETFEAAVTGEAVTTTPLRWPLERVLLGLAGSMTLLSAALAAIVSPWFLLLTAFVGLNQWLYVTAGSCPASLVLGRWFGLQPCGSSGAPTPPSSCAGDGPEAR